MGRNRVISRPIKTSDITFDELYDEISADWPRRAQALQVRRWRALKREMKGGY